jgi:GDPmannose 4,6-dehydratase
MATLGIEQRVNVVSMASNDFRSALQTITRWQPDEIYNLAGQTSVGLSFGQPAETIESIAIGMLNLLEAIRFTGREIHFYNAGSTGRCGDTGDELESYQMRFAAITQRLLNQWPER